MRKSHNKWSRKLYYIRYKRSGTGYDEGTRNNDEDTELPMWYIKHNFFEGNWGGKGYGTRGEGIMCER